MADLTAPLSYRDGRLHLEDCDLAELAEASGTPLYVYSAGAIRERIAAFRRGLGERRHLLCFAVKANSNLGVLGLMAREGVGADIVSGGELYRCQRAGIDPRRVVFAGVGKTADEIRAAIQADILLFSVESEGELRAISRVATELGRQAVVSIRVNPDVDAGTHPYISTGLKENKFGISRSVVRELYARARTLPGLVPHGIGFHIGSQLLKLDGFRDAARIVRGLAEELLHDGVPLRHIDVGGGLGIAYQDNTATPSIEEYVRTISTEIGLEELTLVFEPGRALVGNAGVLLSRILYTKQNEAKLFYVADAAMNDLIRPALYQAHHEILPLRAAAPTGERVVADLVGPICETGDFLARGRELPRLSDGDLIALASAGAYGFVMSSNYNSRPRAAEVLVDGSSARVVRRRESLEDLIRGEEV